MYVCIYTTKPSRGGFSRCRLQQNTKNGMQSGVSLLWPNGDEMNTKHIRAIYFSVPFGKN